MNVLITGGRSLLAASLARQLAQRGDIVSLLQRAPAPVAAELGLTQTLADVSDADAVAVATSGVDAVVHCAARVGITGTARQFYETNVIGTQVMLEAARAHGVARFVFVSSPSVAHHGRAIVGQGAAPAVPEQAQGHYSRTKAAAELAVLAADRPGFAALAVRPHLIWGPGDEQLVGRIVRRAAAGRLPLVGGGRALVDTTYLDNAVDALAAALDHAEAAHGRAFVVSNGEPRTLAELCARICAAAGVPGPRFAVPRQVAFASGAAVETAWWVLRRTDDPPMTRFLARQLGTAHWFDLRESAQWLGWEPKVSLDAGFGRLAAYYQG